MRPVCPRRIRPGTGVTFGSLFRCGAIVASFCAASLVAVTPVVAQSAASPAATLERATAIYKSAKTMRVRFDQTITNALTGTTLTSHGELFRKRPNLLAIVFADPANDRVVADGQSVWLYLPSSAPGQVIKLPILQESGTLIDPLGQILETPTSAYTLTGGGNTSIDGHATQAVTMIPKRGAQTLFRQATLWIDDADGTVRQLEATEPSGITRKIVITKYSPNVDIPSVTFKFTPPPNVRIVDGRMGG